PPILRDLVRRTRSHTATRTGASPSDPAKLVARLSKLSRPDQEREMTGLVRLNVAAVLGHEGPDAIQTDRGFLWMGLDSLTAVELRNRLNSLTGLRMPSTLLFDHPTVARLTVFILQELSPADAFSTDYVLAELARIGRSLSTEIQDSDARKKIGAYLTG